MHLRHLFSPRLRGSLLLGSPSSHPHSSSTLAAEDMLRKSGRQRRYEDGPSQQTRLAGYIAKP